MRISGSTKITGIFGHPIGHTLSPAIQNAAFGHLGLDIMYAPFHVSPANLAAAVEAVRALEILGVNVTIPHKEKVIEYLDEVDKVAEEIGAVNTVVNRDGCLVGYNTDGEGFLRSLSDETGFDPTGKRILIVGAGGAARAIFYTLLSRGVASVVIANRTVKRAAELAEEFRAVAGERAVAVAGLDPDSLREKASGADLVVNTTSLGMEGQSLLDFPVDVLPKSSVVSDIVYKPLDTELIKKAKDLGLRVHKGIGMLIHQGALGFELWTGKTAPVDVMTKAAMEELYGPEAQK